MDKIRDRIGFSFADLESVVWEETRKGFIEAMQALLESLDATLEEARDKQQYVLKGTQVRVLQTRVGEVPVRRRYYRDTEAGEWVALLDVALGLEKRVRLTQGIKAVAVEAAVQGRSYRAAAQELAREAGRPVISHETVRQCALKAGDYLEQSSSRYEAEEKRRVGMLFLEVDGFWPSLQRSRKRKGKDKQSQRRIGKREVRLAVSHEGWEPRSPGSSEFRLKQRRDFTYQGGGDFWEEVVTWMEQEYDLADTWVVINGDRAGWIRRGVQWFPHALYQVDRFHLLRDVKRALREQPERVKAALEAITTGDAQGLLLLLKVAAEATEDPVRRKGIRDLYRDLRTMPEAIRDYRLQLQSRGIAVDGLRGMGATEGAVARFSARLRMQGRSWSQHGLGAMLQVLVAWFAGSLGNAVRTVERLAGLEPPRQARASVKHRAVQAAVSRLDWAHHGHFPALEMGRNASGGLSRTLRHLAHALPNV